MSLFRTVAAFLSGLIVAAAALGFVVQQSLGDTAGFTARMDDALATPAVQEELNSAIRTEVTRAGDRLAQSVGPLGDLARSGAQAAADQLGAAVQSDRFRAAWSQWCALLYTGLAEVAQGAPSSTVAVSGSNVTVAVGPLITPLVGDTLSGGVTGLLGTLGQSTTVTLDTGIRLEQALQAAGTTATYRWGLLVVALLLLLVVVVPRGRRPLWAGWSLLWCAGCVGLIAYVTQRAPDAPSGDYPAIAGAVVGALTQPWVQPLTTLALALAMLGGLTLVVGAFRRPGRPAR